MKRVALGAALLLLCSAAPAQAGWRMQRAEAVAAIVWHAPCPEGLQWRWSDLGDPADGEADAAVASPGVCAVTFNSRLPLGWRAFCRTLLHEVGHIAGVVQHSTNPHSVMYPTFSPYFDAELIDGEWVSQRDPRCRDRGRPYLERHGAVL